MTQPAQPGPIVCPDCHQTRPPLNLIHQCHGCVGCAVHAEDVEVKAAGPDSRRPCERVTDGRCMFEADTCTPTCHLDWGTDSQTTPAQPCLSTPDCATFDGCPSCRPEDYAW